MFQVAGRDSGKKLKALWDRSNSERPQLERKTRRGREAWEGSCADVDLWHAADLAAGLDVEPGPRLGGMSDDCSKPATFPQLGEERIGNIWHAPIE